MMNLSDQTSPAQDSLGSSGDVEALTTCPVCESRVFKAVTTPRRWIGSDVFGGLQDRIGLVACRGCGLVFGNPRPSAELLATFYAGDNYGCHDTSYSASAGASADYRLSWAARHTPHDAPRRLLDYGAGG